MKYSVQLESEDWAFINNLITQAYQMGVNWARAESPPNAPDEERLKSEKMQDACTAEYKRILDQCETCAQSLAKRVFSFALKIPKQ